MNFLQRPDTQSSKLILAMKTHFLMVTGMFFLCLILTACDSMQSEDAPVSPRPLTESEQRIVEADNQFGLRLFDSINEQAPAENLFISPTSISMALGMTLNGADGATRDELVALLEKQDLTEESINASYQSLIRLLSGLDPEVILSIANSIWYREGAQIEPSFLEKSTTYFEAEVASLDFNDPESVDTINSWVDDKTNGLIDSIIQQISPNTIMYLINAIYFKGNWTAPFDPELTATATFNNLSGGTSEVDMMTQRGIFPYFQSDRATYIDLPYGDSLYSMTVILPEDSGDINALITELSEGQFNAAVSQLDRTEVDLFFPRFTLAYETKLRDVLRGMGLEQAFDESRADFTRIQPNGGLYLSDVIHKSFVEVNEEGTEAAAVTGVIIEATSVGPPTPIVRVDKPFIFLIREKSTGTYLFAGKITEL